MLLFNVNQIKQIFKDKYSVDLVQQVIKESNLYITENLLKGDDFSLPKKLGFIIICKFKHKRVFDYIHWCKTGEIKKQINNHTFNYIYKIVWGKGHVNKTKKSLLNNVYKFSASRDNLKRPLAKILKSGKDFYKGQDFLVKFGNINFSYLNNFNNNEKK